jgi:hypothetical protein
VRCGGAAYERWNTAFAGIRVFGLVREKLRGAILCLAAEDFTMAPRAMRVYKAAFRMADIQIGNREGLKVMS